MAKEDYVQWQPHTITDIDFTTAPRSGYIGRAAFVVQNGIEFVVLAKNEEQLDLVTQNFMGFDLNRKDVYRATMIDSNGVSIDTEQVFDEPKPTASPLGEKVADAIEAESKEVPVEDDDEL